MVFGGLIFVIGGGKVKRILVIILIIALSAAACLTASAEISVSAPESVTAGKTFTAVLNVGSEPALSAIHLSVRHGGRLVLTDIRKLQDGSFSYNDTATSVDLILISKTTLSEGGAVQFRFRAPDEEGDADITVEVVQALDSELRDVSPETVGCTVCVGENTGSVSSSRARSSSSNKSSSKRSSSVKSSRASRSSRAASSKKSSGSGKKTSSAAPEETAAEPPSDVSSGAQLVEHRESGSRSSVPAIIAASAAIAALLAAAYKMGQLSRSRDGRE